MCGIAGIVALNQTKFGTSTLQALSQQLSHRGPDDVGFLSWTQGRACQLSHQPAELVASQVHLLHRRLSILDLTQSGWQPMGTADGRYYIVFNGEIYNYLELRSVLEGLGYIFTSQSDTEVLLYAYAEWGSSALPKLVGMFAFSILDTQTHRLFLARDSFGIKPLYYAISDDGFSFASEIPALLAIPGISRKANPRAVYSYLHSNHTDHAQATLFADIQQLPPAHYVEVSIEDPSALVPQRYWNIALDNRLDISFKHASEQLRALFLDSVRLHLRSDVPVGASLSGGIDSSAIVMAMRHLQGSTLELHTFSYVANQAALSEEKWIDQVTSATESMVHKVTVTPDALTNDLDTLISTQGEPFGSTTIYAQYRVFQLAKSAGIKVMLDGQGADELLGGYRPYLGARLASLVMKGQYAQAYQFVQKASQLSGVSPKFLLTRMGGLLLPEQFQRLARPLAGRQRVQPWMNADWVYQHGAMPMSLRLNQQKDVLQEQLYKALTQVSIPMLLRYEDRNSMAHSIESRVPFLTPALAEFLLALPEEYLISAEGQSKHVFREAMRGLVPNSILDRRDKIGFATPELSWMITIKDWFEGVLNSETAHRIPALNVAQMQQHFMAMVEGQAPFDLCVWRWVNLIRWVECFDVVFED